MRANVHKLSIRQESPSGAQLVERAKDAIAAARARATAVDRDGRFPQEAFDALKAAKLLGAAVPAELGGLGADMTALAALCSALGEACSAAGLIYAMHCVKIVCVARHHGGDSWMRAFLEDVAARQWLVASSTTEGSRGGDIRNSEAAIQQVDGKLRLERRATVISYVEHADALVTTARRAQDAAAADQVLLVLRRADYALTPLQGWDTFGMRGTCSKGFALVASAEPSQVVAEDYALIHVQSMIPAAHLLWGAVWLGIASEAYRRARDFTRAAARSAGGSMPPGAMKLAQARQTLDALRALIARNATVIGAYESGGPLNPIEVTMLKVEASELALETVQLSMRVTGLAGYRNDGEFSCGRLLRDVMSGPIMINNERIVAGAQAGLMMSEAPAAAQFLL